MSQVREALWLFWYRNFSSVVITSIDYTAARLQQTPMLSQSLPISVQQATQNHYEGCVKQKVVCVLVKPASAINLAAVVRLTEPGSSLVECFDVATNTCVIDQACGLKHVLHDALESFYKTLAQVTLADLVVRPRDLSAIFELRTPNKKRSRN